MHSNGSCLGLTLRRRNHHWKVGQDGFSARVAQMRGGAGAERLHGGLDLAQRRPSQRGALVTSRHVWFFSVSWRSGDRPARGRERSRRGVIVHAGGQGGAGGAAPLLHGALCRGLLPDETLESPWRELHGRRRCTLSAGTSASSGGLPAAAGLMRFRSVASGAGAQTFAGPLVGPPEVGHAAAPPHGHHPANFLLPHVTPGFEVRSGRGPAEEERGAVKLLRRVLG